MRSRPAADCSCALTRAPHNPRYVQVPARVVRFAVAALVAPRVVLSPAHPHAACSRVLPSAPKGAPTRGALTRAACLR